MDLVDGANQYLYAILDLATFFLQGASIEFC